MTKKEFEQLEKVLEQKGYKKHNAPRMMLNEDYSFYKGFAYTEDDNGDREPGYQIFFLVWDWERMGLAGGVIAEDKVGVFPHFLTSNGQWSRTDLMITGLTFDVDEVERYFKDFYYFTVHHGHIEK